MVVAGLLIWAVGPDVVRSPWNPWITVLPLLAVIALAWNATAGDLWSYPLAVAGGSFVVQSHVGYAAVTLAVLGGAAVIVLVIARAQAGRLAVVCSSSGSSRWACSLVLWAPPVYQQVRDEPGNLSELRQFFSDAKADHTLDDGIRVTVEELGVVPGAGRRARHRPRRRTIGRRAGPGVATVLALAAAVAVAAWRRCTGPRCSSPRSWRCRSCAAIWSVSRVIGPIEDYLVLWVAVTGAARVDPRVRRRHDRVRLTGASGEGRSRRRYAAEGEQRARDEVGAERGEDREVEQAGRGHHRGVVALAQREPGDDEQHAGGDRAHDPHPAEQAAVAVVVRAGEHADHPRRQQEHEHLERPHVRGRSAPAP